MSDKKTLFINGKEVEFTNEPNLLEVIKKAGFSVPTLCYRPDLTQFGACRLCVVEIDGRGIQSSCTMPPEVGLRVKTNTMRVRRIRKTVLELLLANHNRECTTCEKSGNCDLQKYANEYGITDLKYMQRKEMLPEFLTHGLQTPKQNDLETQNKLSHKLHIEYICWGHG